jgi:RNA polymerase sigma-70 factor (ECF subfamily)
MDADGLLAATYRGDLRAFEALVRSQAGRLHHIAARVTGDWSLADDVLQETFLRVLRVPAAARPSRAAAMWLARVTVRVALDILDSERARRRREERYAMERNGKIKDGAPSRSPLPSDLEPAIAEALASLSPETRAAIWLNVVEGEGVREVAAFLDSSRSTVSRRIRAGLEALRGRLATSGLALAGTAALRGILRGSEIPPPEPLVEAIVAAGKAAMAGSAASPAMPEALDRVREAAAYSTTEATKTFVLGGWPNPTHGSEGIRGLRWARWR